VSGSIPPNDVPFIVTTGDSAQRVKALADQFERLQNEVKGVTSAFETLGVGRKQITDITSAVRTLSSILSTNSLQVSSLNALSTRGSNAVRAASELGVQRANADPQRTGNALLSRNPQRLTDARKANERLIAELELRRQAISSQIADIDKALTTAPAFGKGSRSPGGASPLRKLRIQLEQETAGAIQTLEGLRDAQRRIQEAVERTSRQTSLQRSLQGRRDRFYVNAVFDETPEGIQARAARDFAAGQKQVERERRAQQRLNDAVANRTQTTAERENGSQDTLFRTIRRNDFRSMASRWQAAGRDEAQNEADGERAVARLRRGFLNTVMREGVDQRKADVKVEADLEKQFQSIRTRSLLDSIKARRAGLEAEERARGFERVRIQEMAERENRERDKEARRLREQREREAQALPSAISRRLTGAQAETSILDNPQQRAILAAAQSGRLGLNQEALLGALRPGTSFYEGRLQIAQMNGNLNQAVRLRQLDDPEFQARDNQIASRRSRQRLSQQRDDFNDPQFREESRSFNNQRNMDRLFGDGGGAIFQTQARLLLNYTILNQFQTALVASAQAVVEFDNALKNLQAISNSTNGEMEALRKTIVDVSLGTKFSAVELTQAATTMAQAGLGLREIDQGLRAVALLATATGSEIATAVDIATTALSVFRLRASELPSVADQMTAALNLSKLTIDQVALGFQYVGNTAAEAGLSFAETTAALATLANQGIRSGSTMGTGFRQLIVDLQQPNENLARRMRELGISMADVDVRANGLVGVFSNLREAGFTSADAFATIELRAAAAFSAFSRGADDMNELQRGILDANGAAAANAVQMESLTNRFLQLRNTTTALLSDAMTPFLNVLKEMVSGINEVLLSATGATTAIQLLGGALTALAVGAVIRGMVGLAASVIATQAAFTGAATGALGLSAALRAVPMLGWIATVGTAVAMLVDFGGAQAKATAELEKSRQAVNETVARYREQREALQSVNEFMTNTIARTVALERDQNLLNTTIAEARNRFGSLSTAVYDNITSYGELIGVLRRVRGELSATMLLRAQEAEQAAGARVVALTGAANTTTPQSTLEGVASAFGGRAASQFRTNVLPNAREPGVSEQARGIAALRGVLPERVRTNPEISAGLDVLRRQGTIPLEEMAEAATTLARALSAVNSQAEQLGVTPAQQTALTNFLRDRASVFRDLGQARGAQRQAQAVSRSVGYVTSRDGQQITDGASNLNVEVTRRLAEIRPELPLSERQEMIRELQRYVSREVDSLETFAASAPRADTDPNSTNPRTVGENLLASTEFESITARVRQAASALNVTIVTAEAERTAARLSAAERNYQNAINRGRDERDPAAARASADVAEQAAREAGRIELERNRARRAQEQQRTPLDPETLSIVTREEEAGIASRVEQRVREGRRQATEAVVAAIEDQLKMVQEELRGLTQRGRTPNPTATDAARRRARELITEIGTLRGDSPEMISSRVQRFNGSQGRADFSQARAGGGYSSSTDPLRFMEANFNSRIQDVERDIRNDRTAAEGPVRVLQAEQDAARRVPGNFSQGYLIRLEERLNDAQITAQQRIAESQQRRVAGLADVRSQAVGERDRRVEGLRQIRAANGGDLPLNEQTTGLQREVETLQQVINKVDDLTREAGIVAENAAGMVVSRQSVTVGNVGDAMEDARASFRREFGLDETPFKTFTDNLTTAFGEAQRATSDFFFNFATGAKSTGDAARQMATSVLQSVGRMASNRLASILLDQGIKLASMAITGGVADMSATGGSQPGGGTPDYAGMFPVNRYHGGMVPYRFSRGTSRVPGPDIGRDMVPAMLSGGEAVLNRRAASLIGEETISDLNAGRARTESQVRAVAPKPRAPDNVSVYVMAPNERPSLGPKDVIAIIGQDVLTGGQSKQLIKQVAVGAI
jgi:TP901 family phage tail tape measure protein